MDIKNLFGASFATPHIGDATPVSRICSYEMFEPLNEETFAAHEGMAIIFAIDIAEVELMMPQAPTVNQLLVIKFRKAASSRIMIEFGDVRSVQEVPVNRALSYFRVRMSFHQPQPYILESAGL
jgi:hypothetical protein